MSLPPLFSRLRLPVIGAPLFIVSNPDLVIAQCKAGIVGSFPALNARPQSLLDEWLHRITEELGAWDRDNPDRPAAPFAVNQIVHRSNARLQEDMATCAKWKVPIVITSLGAREDVNQAVHSYGGIVLHDIINNKFAHKAIEKGADGLIAVAAGAGGHAGTLSPFALVSEIREVFAGTVILSGAITRGAHIAAALALGADGVVAGTRFWATRQAAVSRAAQARALAIDGDATRRTGVYDIVRGKDWPPVYTGRVLANDFVVRWHGHETELVEHLDDARAEYTHAVEADDLDHANMIVGEAVGQVHAIEDAGDVVRDMAAQAEDILTGAPRGRRPGA